MSYDLGVFRSAKELDAASAAALYDRICARSGTAVGTDALEESASLDAFHRELVARYPTLDDDDDESPFACALDRTARWIVMSIVPSRADEVTAFVEARALAHGLDCFNPQEGSLLRARDPSARPRPAPSPRLAPKVGLARFVAGIGPRLGELGFAPVRPRGAAQAWGRTTSGGIVQQVILDLGTRDVRLRVAFGAPAAIALVRAVRPEEPRPIPEDLVEALRFRGWIPGEPWAPCDEEDGTESDFAHAICHDACVARSIDTFPRAVERYALPLFARMGSPVALEELMSRPAPLEPPRPNWGGTALWQRAWNHEVSMLHRLALARVVRGDDGARPILADCEAKLAAWKEARAGWYSARLEAQLGALARMDLAASSAPPSPRSGAARRPAREGRKKRP